MRRRKGAFLFALLTSAAAALPAAAQQATIAGTVTDAGTGLPLPQVQVAVQGAQTGALTSESGRFTIPVAPGTYTVEATMIGYDTKTLTGVQVQAGQAISVGIALESRAVVLDPIQVTVGKKAEKATEAPATVSVVSQEKIQERIATGPIDHIKSVVGVDMINYGVSAGNVTVRGFNNAFSGAVHFLTDNRVASIPSLQVNLMQFVPSTDEDIARIEVVLGPGSALYGPNTANGVIHLITRSPLEGTSTTASIAGGERSVLKGVFRTSQLLNDNFGVKLSGSFFKGREWPFTDRTEVAAAADAKANPATFQALNQITAAEAARVGQRDLDIFRWGGEARADWRFTGNGTAIFQVGRTSNDGIEVTGLGAGQTNNWVYSYYQARFNVGRLFAQAYLNTSNSGDSFLLKRGAALVDRSKMWVGQLQHGVALGGDRLDVIYGLDYRKTTPDSKGTIYGRYEDKDEITELGGYGQAELKPTDMLRLVGALRLDHTSVLEDPLWSPRAALVFQPKPTQSLRLTYNRATNTPTTLNMFLDVNGGRVTGQIGQLGYLLHGVGPGEDGLHFKQSDGSYRMLSPFSGAPSTPQVLSAQNLWNDAVNFLVARGAIPAAQAALFRSMNMSSVAVLSLNPLTQAVTPFATTPVEDVPRIEPSTTNTLEFGYQGVLGQKLGLSADVWKSKLENFTSPLTPWTPLLLLNASQTVPVMVPVLTQAYQAAGLPAAQAQAQAQAQATAIATGIGPVPMGIVTDPTVKAIAADMFVTYINYVNIDLWGADLSATALLTPEWTLGVTGSFVSDDYFKPERNGVKQTVALNAPDKKATISLGYSGASNGFFGEARARITSGFPASSADFQGTKCIGGTGDFVEDCVASATVTDLSLGYKVPKSGATVQLTVSNLFDTDYRNFVAVPTIGRLALLQLKYDF